MGEYRLLQVRKAWEPVPTVRLADLVSALSYALDLTEGQPMGHAQRACVWGMRIAECIGMPYAQRADLYYALLLKDAGCGSDATRLHQILNCDEVRPGLSGRFLDWSSISWRALLAALDRLSLGHAVFHRLLTRSRTGAPGLRQQREVVLARGYRGASIVRKMGFPEATATAILELDEHWDGGGEPAGLRRHDITVLARILSLAQTLEVFHRQGGLGSALAVARERSGAWFDPDLVRAVHLVAQQPLFEFELDNALETSVRLAPDSRETPITEERVEIICEAFADVVDAKSPYTYQHSHRVTAAAVEIAQDLQLPASQVTLIRRAALLHDLGKLSVPSFILEKPGPLTPVEWKVVRAHPYHSHQILSRIPGFEQIAEVAGAHHERLDGSGYHRGFHAHDLPLPARILAVADVYDALAAERPYRPALPPHEVYGLLRRQAPHALDGVCVESVVGLKGLAPVLPVPEGLVALQSAMPSQVPATQM